MGTICILLGIIFLIGCTLGGVFLASKIYDFVESFVVTLSSTFASIDPVALSRTKISIVVIGICAVIGLLICLNLTMHGLTYNKLNKIMKKRHQH